MKRKIEKFFGLINSPKKEAPVKKNQEIKEADTKKHAHKSKHVKSKNELMMKEVKNFDHGRLSTEHMKQFTKEVNQLITQYNLTSDHPEKKNILQQIQDKITAVDYQYPPSLLASSNGYKAVHAALFTDVKKQMALMGNDSLLSPEAKASPLAEVVANMSPEKTESLMSILVKGNTNVFKLDLQKLYKQDDQSAEANSFRDFLNTHEIKYLGGGNSKNFSVTNLKNNNTQVLKVDCRLDMPKNVEAHLRDKLGSQFAPVEVERQVTFKDTNGQSISRTLLVTEFCTGGSVLECRWKALSDNEQLVEKGTRIFEQMADVMLQIQQQGCMFPDAKLTNWLVKEDGKITLADTKSFVFVDTQGIFSNFLPGNEYVGILRTGGFDPPEFYSGRPKADSVHAYILGKNLYTFMTGKFISGHSGSQFDFSSDVFNSVKGRELKNLIIELVKPNAANRMSVTAARDKLSYIINNEVFLELEGLKFGPNDQTMIRFIADKKQQLDAVKNNPAEREQIMVELRATVTDLKADAAANEVRTIIDNYRKNDGIFTMGMNAKADKIEQAMVKVPIAERGKLVDSSSSTEVMQALASHRYLGKQGKVYLTSKNEIDTEKSATTYKNFKARFIDQREKLNANSADQSNVKEVDENKGMKLK